MSIGPNLQNRMAKIATGNTRIYHVFSQNLCIVRVFRPMKCEYSPHFGAQIGRKGVVFLAFSHNRSQ